MIALGVVALLGALYTLYQLPQSLVRFLIARVMATRYRLNVIGLDNMPAQGGVLMLGNHVSWIDWAMVQLASPRPVRFVMERWIYERWYLRWFLDFFGVVPISRGRSREAIKTVARLLDAGEVVCIFPEGTLSKNGQLSEFKRGFELSAREASVGRHPALLSARSLGQPFFLRQREAQGQSPRWAGARRGRRLRSAPAAGRQRRAGQAGGGRTLGDLLADPCRDPADPRPRLAR